MPTLLKDLIKGIKELASFSKGEIKDAEELLRSTESGIEAADSAFKELKVAKADGLLTIGAEPIGSFNKILREADLRGIVNLAKKTIPVSEEQVAAFKKLIGPTNESVYKDLIDDTAKNVEKYPHLNVTINNIDTLSETAKRDIKQVESKLSKKFKTGTKITLTLGTLAVGANWVIKATAERKGCYMLTTINNTVSSCKVSAFTCVGGVEDNLCPEFNANNYYNITLIAMYIANLDNSDEMKNDLAKLLKISAADFSLNFAQCLEDNFAIISDYVIGSLNNTRKLDFGICDIVREDVEGGIVPTCRLCSPSASPKSTEYINPGLYGDNITFQCCSNPTIMETITDVMKTTGENLLEGLTEGFFALVKPFAFFLAILLAILIVAYIVVKFIIAKATRNRDDVNFVQFENTYTS